MTMTMHAVIKTMIPTKNDVARAATNTTGKSTTQRHTLGLVAHVVW